MIPFTPSSYYKTIQTNGEKNRIYIGMTLHINSYNKSIMQIPVVKEYPSKPTQKDHHMNYSS